MLYIESATGKFIPKLSTSAKGPLGSLMAFKKRAQSGWKVAIGMCSVHRAVGSLPSLLARAHRAVGKLPSLCASVHRAVGSLPSDMYMRAQSSWKFAIALCTPAQSSWKFASPYFTFFQATKFSSSTYNNVTIS